MLKENKTLIICWAFMSFIFTIDFITTIIGVEVLGFFEQNIFANNFFGFGVFGYWAAYFVYLICFFSVLMFSGIILNIISKATKVKIKTEVMYCLICSFYIFIDGISILNNLGWISGFF